MIASLRSRLFNALACCAGALLIAPTFAGDGSAALLFVPIKVNVTPPAATAPAITGNFVFTVTCANTTWAFAAPALTLVANALPTPFVTALMGEAQSSNTAMNSSGCTVTQTARPAPPAGFLWSGTPPPVNTGTVSVPSIAPPARAPLSSFSNTLVTAIPITLAYNPPGAGVVTCNPNPVPSGDRSVCDLTSTNPGYTFINMTGCNGSSDGSYFTENLTAPCTITANFQPDPVPITTTVAPVTLPASGTLSCNPNPGLFGATSVCTAAPAADYAIVGISGCGGTSATLSMTTGTLSAACEVIATFALKKYVVTAVANPVAAGAVTCASPVNSGATSLCSVTTTTAGYTFTGWTTSGCGTPASTAPYTTNALTAACTVTAAFTLNQYVVTAAASPANAGVVTCATPVNHGATSACSVSSTTAGYTFTGWTTSGCGTPASTATYTTNALTAGCTVTAAFTLNRYVVTAASNPTIAGVVTCATPVNHGATSACSVTSTTAGYTFTGWTTSGCGAPASTATYTTNALTAPCTVTGTFALNVFSVTGVASPVAGGVVTCASPVNFNATASCTAGANAGYTLTSISGCGGTASATSPYTTGAVTANCTVTGNFVLNTYAITTVASPAAGGTLACAPNPVAHSSTALCTATPNAGYSIAPITGTAAVVPGAKSAKALSGGIGGCGGAPIASSPFTTAAVTAPCTVTVNFVLNTFPVATNVVVSGGGTLNCTAASVAFGATTTCTASANAGFTLTGISGCGGVPSTTSSFTTGAVTAACTVTARFVAAAVIEPAVQVPALDPWLVALMALLTALCGTRVLAARRRSARGETR